MTERTLVDPNATPRSLWAYRQFVAWKYVDRGATKPDKVPVNPRNLANAGVSWPNTWSDVRKTVAVYLADSALAGIGFVLTGHDPYTMIDIDNCVSAGSLSTFASNVVDRLGTYTEFSPSGHGLRLFVDCPAQPPALKRPEIEIYSSGRWATLTGHVLNQKPIAQVPDLDWLVGQFKAKPNQPLTHSFLSHSDPSTLDDHQLWTLIFSKNPLAEPLYNGDLSEFRQDHSRAVIMLLNSLAFWTSCDAGRMERMIQQTNLDKTKWHDGRGNQTWLTGRIQDAINYMNGRK